MTPGCFFALSSLDPAAAIPPKHSERLMLATYLIV